MNKVPKLLVADSCRKEANLPHRNGNVPSSLATPLRITLCGALLCLNKGKNSVLQLRQGSLSAFSHIIALLKVAREYEANTLAYGQQKTTDNHAKERVGHALAQVLDALGLVHAPQRPWIELWHQEFAFGEVHGTQLCHDEALALMA